MDDSLLIRILRARDNANRSMFGHGTDSTRLGHADLSTGFSNFGGNKALRFAANARVLKPERVVSGNITKASVLARGMADQFNTGLSLLHIKPSKGSHASMYPDLDPFLPNAERQSAPSKPSSDELRAGMTIPSMSPFPKPGQSFDEFKRDVEARKPTPAAPRVERQQTTEPKPRQSGIAPQQTGRIFSRVQEMPAKREFVEAEPETLLEPLNRGTVEPSSEIPASIFAHENLEAVQPPITESTVVHPDVSLVAEERKAPAAKPAEKREQKLAPRASENKIQRQLDEAEPKPNNPVVNLPEAREERPEETLKAAEPVELKSKQAVRPEALEEPLASVKMTEPGSKLAELPKAKAVQPNVPARPPAAVLKRPESSIGKVGREAPEPITRPIGSTRKSEGRVDTHGVTPPATISRSVSPREEPITIEGFEPAFDATEKIPAAAPVRQSEVDPSAPFSPKASPRIQKHAEPRTKVEMPTARPMAKPFERASETAEQVTEPDMIDRLPRSLPKLPAADQRPARPLAQAQATPQPENQRNLPSAYPAVDMPAARTPIVSPINQAPSPVAAAQAPATVQRQPEPQNLTRQESIKVEAQSPNVEPALSIQPRAMTTSATPVIQRMWEEHSEMSDSAGSGSSKGGEAQGGQENDLELLASQVLPLVKHLLEIEIERTGGRFGKGR